MYCWARIRPWCLRSPSTTLPLPQEGLGTWLMRSAASATLPDKSPRRQSSLLKRIDLQVPLAKWLCRFASADYACRSMPTIHGKSCAVAASPYFCAKDTTSGVSPLLPVKQRCSYSATPAPTRSATPMNRGRVRVKEHLSAKMFHLPNCLVGKPAALACHPASISINLSKTQTPPYAAILRRPLSCCKSCLLRRHSVHSQHCKNCGLNATCQFEPMHFCSVHGLGKEAPRPCFDKYHREPHVAGRFKLPG